MAYSIRFMERADVPAVRDLLRKVFGAQSPLYADWDQLLEWQYFSSAIAESAPRALVIADGASVAGHIGWTLSEFTDGEKRFGVVQTGNWAVDPACRVGLLAVRLMQQALAARDVALVIGGSKDTQRIVPKLGFQRLGRVDRYLKVFRPSQYLLMSRSGEKLVRNVGKLMLCLTHFQPSFLTIHERGSAGEVNTGANGYHNGCHGGRRLEAGPAPRILRNALTPWFLHWYQQCPKGQVHVLNFYRTGNAVLGQAVVLIREQKGKRYANLLNVDAPPEDPSAWDQILGSVESFLTEKGVAHVNTLASFEPWSQALRRAGYCRVSSLPVWFRDKGAHCTGATAWHLTPIEGDLGCLLE